MEERLGAEFVDMNINKLSINRSFFYISNP